jgi:tRNA/rRNA methyltransferase
MAWVDRTDWFSNFAVGIVEPEFAINVGYIARTMANFGLGRLYIISSKQSFEGTSEAMKFASHGFQIIENAKHINTLDELREKFMILVGTTAIQSKRKSNITRKTYTLEEAIPIILKSYGESMRHFDYYDEKRRQKGLCFVFGRDTTGLTNEELRKCDYNLTIVTGTEYNTLNISHSAAIIFHAFRSHLRHHASPRKLGGKAGREATRKEKERVVNLFGQLASVSDFQYFKQEKLVETIDRILKRSNPSLRELYLLMGLASKAQSKIKRLSDYGK